MKGIVKAAKIATKIVEVFHWVGTALMLAATVCSLAAPAWVKYLVGINAKECCGAELNVYGFEVIAPVENGSIDMKALFCSALARLLFFLLWQWSSEI